MNSAAENRTCPGCGAAIPANAPQGICPKCLMAAVAVATDAGQTGALRPEPPSLERLAAAFPQLEVIELIGQGGMGAVYKARQKQLDRIVALKVLPPGIGGDASFAERFTREAKALAKLLHPNIVALFEFGQADGIYYLLMEYVDGVSLGQLLRSSRVSSREALAIVPQICDALQYAHDQGIVHRDIKPENILLDRRGRVKVADFGLAKLVGAGSGRAGSPLPAESGDGTSAGAHGVTRPAESLTGAGKIMGTPNYMAPEQVEHPGEVDHRADIYALGVVFYQMLTGELPGKPLAPPSSKVHIDVRLDEVVLRALEQKPELRYQQASVLRTQIETIASTPAGEAAAAATPPNAKPSGPRRLKKREIPVIGVRDGQRVIHWPGVAFRILVALAVSAPLVYAVNGAAGVDPFLPVIFVVISIWLGIKCLRDWAQPIEKLPCLDEPSIDAPSATPPSETATAGGKPWVSFCVTLTYLGTCLFGLLPLLFGLGPNLVRGHDLNQWPVGIFVELICLTPLLAVLLNQSATPQAWRKWFKLAAWLGMVAWLLAIGFALLELHFIYGLDQAATLVLLDQWSVGIFIKLICLTSLLALLLNQLATPQAWRKWSKLAAWLGMVAWLLAIGSALFALCLRYGLDQRATLDDTIFESFIWLGAIALPICIVRLWRAANKPVTGSGASVPPAEPARKNSTGKSIALGCGVLVAGGLVVLLLLAMAGLFSSGTQVAPTFGPVIEPLNKPVSDFPETTDLSTPESACAAWQRANARKDAQAVSRLSWVKIDPAEEEAWFRNEEARDPEGLAIYLKALTESKIVEVQTWRGDLANVITFLPFPPGKGRHPYSARSFGRIGGQWKNLGEDRLPSLEAARANFAQKKAAIWEQLQSLQPAASGVAPVAPPVAAKPVPLHRVIELTLADVRSDKESLASLATGGIRPPDFTAVGGDDQGGRAWLRAHDIDLVYYARADSGDSGVGAYDLRLAKVPNAQFNSLDSNGLVKALSGVERTEGGLMSVRDGLPVTYVFETRRGLGGVLQITGFTETPPAVKIRYKLVLPQRDEGT